MILDGPAMLGVFGVPKDLKGDPQTVIGIKGSEERGLEGVRNYRGRGIRYRTSITNAVEPQPNKRK